MMMPIGFQGARAHLGRCSRTQSTTKSVRWLVTKAPVKRTRREPLAAVKTPAIRRNTKRIHEAMARTTIDTTVLTLAASQPRYVLGLDINTNSTGYAVLDADGRVASWGHISTTHVPSSDILGIAHAISDELPRIKAACVDDEEKDTSAEWRVGIEDFMRMYRFGKFHNKGIFQLAQLNGIVSYECWQRFGCRPVHTHPSAARGLFGIVAGGKASIGKKSEVKDQVMRFVLEQERDSHAGHELRKLHVNRYGQWTDAAFDIADAYVVAAYTRWMALQNSLLDDAKLQQEFSDAYVGLVFPSEEMEMAKKRSKAPTVEEKALLRMLPDAKRVYLKELFVLGVADWVKTHHRPEVVVADEG